MKLRLPSTNLSINIKEGILSFSTEDELKIDSLPEVFMNYIKVSDRERRCSILINKDGTYILLPELEKKINDTIMTEDCSIVVNSISYCDVCVVSLKINLSTYEGAIDKFGNIISPFTSGKPFTNVYIDRVHKRFITENAVYDEKGEVICSGYDNIIWTFDECNYMCTKEYSSFIFNEDNQRIRIKYGWSDGVSFSPFKHGYTIMRMVLNEEGIVSESILNKYGEELCSGEKIEITNCNILCKKGKYINSYSLDNCQYLQTYVWKDDFKSLMRAQKIKTYIVTEKDIKKYGYVSYPDKQVIPFIYDNVSLEYGDYAIVEVNGKKGLIDEKGKMIVAPRFDHIQKSKTSNILLANNGGHYDGHTIQGGLWGVLTEGGQIICEPTYSEIKMQDKYLIIKQDDKCEMIDIQGKMIIPAKYKDISFPHCNLIRVQAEVAIHTGDILHLTQATKLYWGFVDMNGEMKINPRFDYVRDFYADRAAYYENGYYGFIDKNGIMVIPPIFSDVSDFDERSKLAKVECINGSDRYENSINLDGTIDSTWKCYSNSYAFDKEDKEQEYRGMLWDAFEDDPDALWNID